jgi:2-iminobutanoate/2-iminopropanoate deaminase
MAQAVRAPGLAEPLGHYSDAVRSGNLLFLSGCVALDRDGSLVGAGDVVAQTRQVFANIGEVLAAAGAGFADVVKLTIYLTDIADRVHMSPIRREFFGDWKPASTLVAVSALALPELLVEVEAVAELAGAD